MFSGGFLQKAGYYLEYLQSLRHELESASGLDITWAIERLCSFSVRLINLEEIQAASLSPDWKPILAVCHNLIIRGAPTYPTIQVEKFLLDCVSNTVKTEAVDEQTLALRDNLPAFLKEAWITVLVQAHAAAGTETVTPEQFDSSEENQFLQIMSEKFGLSIGQLIEYQRPFSTIAKEDESKSFYDQRTDFSLETKNTRVIIEIDGMQHQQPTQKALDDRRDRYLEANNWEVIRIPASDVRQGKIDSHLSNISERIQKDPFLLTASKNHTQPLTTHDAGRAALALVLTPFAVARLQWSAVWALINGRLDVRKPTLRVAVIEWDLPCAFLAFWDLMNTLVHLSNLAGINQKLPAIDLHIFRKMDLQMDDGINSLKAHHSLTAHVRKRTNLEQIRKEEFDLVISISTLQTGPRDLKRIVGQNPCIAIDSVYSPRGPRAQIESAPPIRYRLNAEEPTDDLTFFLHWIFRKKHFREGQFEMIRKTLALQDLIGLLPTSGGKSLCYQLSALLQAGTSLVVDPIISLMIDQTENLKQLQIDAIGLVSSAQTRQEHNEALHQLVERNLLLFFVSPERLQIPTFRETLKSLCQTTPVPYLVIDEAHCISEWGHDFRPSYLKLVDNGKKACTYSGKYQPRLIALTGTASSVVLSDIQRVIGLSEDDIVTPGTFDRPELEFKVKKCQSFGKWRTLKESLLELPSIFNKSQKDFFNPRNAGIIFCPHVGWIYGIVEVAGRIRKELQDLIPSVRMYSGRPPKGFKETVWKQLKTRSQREFKENIASLMVATKAFGMGIDKPNIRYTIHYNMPTSLEAFYQEAGRAGRDRSKALCTLIFSGDTSKWKQFFDPNVTIESLSEEMDTQDASQQDDVHRMLYFHKRSWEGVEREYEGIKDLIDSSINPAVNGLKIDECTLVRIPFETGITDDEGDDSRTRTEKMLYRLSILGSVADYGLDHNASMFEVEVARRSDDVLKSTLLEYVGRYKPAEYKETFSKRVEESQGSTTLEKCLRTLLEFVYEEIEKKRRRMILQMAEVAATSQDSEAFRKAILNYLETSEFSKKLDKIAKEMIPDEWVAIASNIEDVNSAHRLLGGCRRALESYPDHPGLLLLSSYARLVTSDETAIDEFERATKALTKSPLNEIEQGETIAKMIQAVALERPGSVSALCFVALQEMPRREIARIALTYSDRSSKTGELALRVLLQHAVRKIQTVRKHTIGAMGGD